MQFIFKTFYRSAITALLGYALFLACSYGGPWICHVVHHSGDPQVSHSVMEYIVDAGPPPSQGAGSSSENPSYFTQQSGRQFFPGRAVARYPGDEGKNHTKIKEVFTPVVASSKHSTVRVLCDNKEVALGTVVGKEGLILTKASELAGIIYCQFGDGEKLSAAVLGVSRENDLALLKVKSGNLIPVEWRDADFPKVGSFLSTVGLSNEPIAFGVMSVSPRKINTPSGFLGVQLAQDDSGPRIDQIVTGSAAEKAGLKVNDVVKKINDKVVTTSQNMIELVSGFRPGDRLQLLVRRGAEEVDIAATLGRPETVYPGNSRRPRGTEARLAGELSDRRGGFPQAIQHDTVLLPWQCGGPLVDLDGKAVGINIARADRVSTYAIPAHVVHELLPNLESGKLPPPPELQGDNADRFSIKLKQIDQAAKDATTEKKSAQEKLKDAKKTELPDSATDEEKTKAKEAVKQCESALKSAVNKEKKANDALRTAKDTMKKLLAEKE